MRCTPLTPILQNRGAEAAHCRTASWLLKDIPNSDSSDVGWRQRQHLRGVPEKVTVNFFLSSQEDLFDLAFSPVHDNSFSKCYTWLVAVGRLLSHAHSVKTPSRHADIPFHTGAAPSPSRLYHYLWNCNIGGATPGPRCRVCTLWQSYLQQAVCKERLTVALGSAESRERMPAEQSRGGGGGAKRAMLKGAMFAETRPLFDKTRPSRQLLNGEEELKPKYRSKPVGIIPIPIPMFVLILLPFGWIRSPWTDFHNLVLKASHTLAQTFYLFITYRDKQLQTTGSSVSSDHGRHITFTFP